MDARKPMHYALALGQFDLILSGSQQRRPGMRGAGGIPASIVCMMLSGFIWPLLPAHATQAAPWVATFPAQSEWKADGTTEYEVQVRANTNMIPDSIIARTEWHLTLPVDLSGYLTLTRSSLPDPIHNPSQDTRDFFYEIPMGSNWNIIDSSVENGELDYNYRTSSTHSARNRDWEHGLLGCYWFTVSPNAPQWNYTFGLHGVLLQDLGGYGYRSDEGSCNILNQAFVLIPEPASLFLLLAGTVAVSMKGLRKVQAAVAPRGPCA